MSEKQTKRVRRALKRLFSQGWPKELEREVRKRLRYGQYMPNNIKLALRLEKR